MTWARDRVRSLVRQLVDRETRALADLRARPALADPRTLLDARSVEVDDLRDRGRRVVRPRSWPGPTTTSPTSEPARARSRRWRPSSAGTPSCSAPTTARRRSSPRSADVDSRGGLEHPGRRRQDRRDHDRRRGRADRGEPWLRSPHAPDRRGPSGLRGGPGRADRGRPRPRGRRHHARGEPRPLGARREARHDLPGVARRRPASARRRDRRRRGLSAGSACPVTQPGIGAVVSDAASCSSWPCDAVPKTISDSCTVLGDEGGVAAGVGPGVPARGDRAVDRHRWRRPAGGGRRTSSAARGRRPATGRSRRTRRRR